MDRYNKEQNIAVWIGELIIGDWVHISGEKVKLTNITFTDEHVMLFFNHTYIITQKNNLIIRSLLGDRVS